MVDGLEDSEAVLVGVHDDDPLLAGSAACVAGWFVVLKIDSSARVSGSRYTTARWPPINGSSWRSKKAMGTLMQPYEMRFSATFVLASRCSRRSPRLTECTRWIDTAAS